MNKHLISVIIALTSIMIIVGICFGFASYQGRNSTGPTIDIPVSPTILYLDGSVLHFDCLDASNCFLPIDLGDKIRDANNSLQHPLRIGFAYYSDDAVLYTLLSGGARQYLVKVDLRKSQAQILDPSSFIGGLEPGMASMVQDKLVLSTVDGRISVVQKDFSIKAVANLGNTILDFTNANDSKIAAISTNDLLKSWNKQVKVFIVDINSGSVEERILDGPSKEEWFFVTVDQNIQHLYLEPVTNSATLTYTDILEVFDLQSQKITSVPLSNSDALTYSTQTAKRYQYHNMWYYSRRCPCEGPTPAMLINMTTLKPVISPENFLKNETDATFIISPFGNYFLIGTHSHAFVVSSDGKIVKAYDIPSNWIGRDYLFLEYRN